MEVAFCQTFSFNTETFEYETVASDNGNATIIKFPVDEKRRVPMLMPSLRLARVKATRTQGA